MSPEITSSSEEKTVYAKLPRHSKTYDFYPPDIVNAKSDILAALELNFAEVQRALLNHQNQKTYAQRNQYLRKLVGCEIYYLFMNGRLPKEMQDEEWQSLSSAYSAVKDQKTQSVELVRVLHNIKHYSESPSTYKKFIEHCFGKNDWKVDLSRDASGVYPYNSIDAVAEVLNIAVFVWHNNSTTTNELSLAYSYVPDHIEKTHHLYLFRDDATQKFTVLKETPERIHNSDAPTPQNKERITQKIPGDGIGAQGLVYEELASSNSREQIWRPVSEEAGESLEATDEDGGKLCAPKGMGAKPKSASNPAIKGKIPALAVFSKIMDGLKNNDEKKEAIHKWQKIIDSTLDRDAAPLAEAERLLGSLDVMNEMVQTIEIKFGLQTAQQEKLWELKEGIEICNSEQFIQKVFDKDVHGKHTYVFLDKDGMPVINKDGDFIVAIKDDKDGWLTYEQPDHKKPDYKPNYKKYDQAYECPKDHKAIEFEILGCPEWEYNVKTKKVVRRELRLTSDHDELGSTTERQFPMLINADGIRFGGDVYIMSTLPGNLTGYRSCYIFTKNPPALHHIKEEKSRSLPVKMESFNSLVKDFKNHNECIPLQHFLSEQQLKAFIELIKNGDEKYEQTHDGKETYTQEQYFEDVMQGNVKKAATIIMEYEVQGQKEKINRRFDKKLGNVNELERAAKIYERNATNQRTNHGSEAGNTANPEPIGPGIYRVYSYDAVESKPGSSARELAPCMVEMPKEENAVVLHNEEELVAHIDKLWQSGHPFPVNAQSNWEVVDGHLRIADVKFDWQYIRFTIASLKEGRIYMLEEEEGFKRAFEKKFIHLKGLLAESKEAEILPQLTELKHAVKNEDVERFKQILPSIIDQDINADEKHIELQCSLKELKTSLEDYIEAKEKLVELDQRIMAEQQVFDLQIAIYSIKLQSEIIYSPTKNKCLSSVLLTKDNHTGLRAARASNWYLDDSPHPADVAFYHLEYDFRLKVMEEVRGMERRCRESDIMVLEKRRDELINICKGRSYAEQCYVDNAIKAYQKAVRANLEKSRFSFMMNNKDLKLEEKKGATSSLPESLISSVSGSAFRRLSMLTTVPMSPKSLKEKILFFGTKTDERGMPKSPKNSDPHSKGCVIS